MYGIYDKSSCYKMCHKFRQVCKCANFTEENNLQISGKVLNNRFHFRQYEKTRKVW
jgi:hypothetical protein